MEAHKQIDIQSSGLSRRTFIEVIGFTAAAAMVNGCERSPEGKTIPYLKHPVEMTPGTATWYASTCGGCSSACGVLVRVRDGRPIKIEGNPDHPLSKGGICAVAQAALASLYDADRLRDPSLDGRKTTWEQINQEVGSRIAQYRSEGAVRLLTGTIVSPTSRAIVERFLAQFADARHIELDPVSFSAMREAHRRTFGAGVVPRFHIDRAELLVGVEADLLGTWLSPVEFARARADRRRGDMSGEPLRHVQFESRLSLTGASSDRRVQIAPREIPIALSLLGHTILSHAGISNGLPAPGSDALRGNIRDAVINTADELWKHRGSALLMLGLNDPDMQEITTIINQTLDAYDSIIDIQSPSLQHEGDEREFDRLLEEMKRGDVGCLVTWGANPVYTHPRGKEFAEAMKKVATTIAIAERKDETATLASILAPSHHWLESWGDAEPARGVLSLRQPTIAPLFHTRHPEEMLLKWSGDAREYHDVLRSEWQTNRAPDGTTDVVAFWENALHDGAVVRAEGGGRRAESDASPAAQQPRRQAAQTPSSLAAQTPSTPAASLFSRLAERPAATGLDLVLYEKVSLRDGTHGNNPLLHELPDPISRVSWTNYAMLSPSTARRLGVEDGRIVKAARGGVTIELPVRIVVGTPIDTVAIAVGYGRTVVGRVGNGVGANAWGLMERDADGFLHQHASGVTITPTDRSTQLAITQLHDSQEGRELARRHDSPSPQSPAPSPQPTLWPRHSYKGHRWGMTIDLNACIGCAACVVGCQVENNIPVVGPEEMALMRDMHWIRIDRYIDGSEDDPTVDFQPIMCAHCENASCESVCPVAATAHSGEGLNMQAYNRCVGTRYCANNCAYKVRRFNWFDYDHSDPIAALALNPDVTVRTRGVMEKCSLCVQRIEAGKISARNERRNLVDGEIMPACAQSCPTQAIVFGDMADPASMIAHTKNDERNYVPLEELNLLPVVSYLRRE